MDFRVDISGWSCVLLAMLCLTVPVDWMFSGLAAAAVHELCHLFSVKLLGGRIHGLAIGASGAVIVSSPLTPGREICSILAGPAGSLALLLLRRWFPGLALCGLVQGLFNLLPVFPLDGGRALAVLCCQVFPGKAGAGICRGIAAAVLVLMVLAGYWGSFVEKLGAAPVLLSILVLLSAMKTKISCKEGVLRVQ